MGLTAEGRLAFVTNVRDPSRNDPAAPSRGRIVPEWLSGRERTDRFWMRTALSGYNGFNLVAFDFRAGECFFATNDGRHPRRLERGIHGLSNAALDTPWPKVVALKSRLREALGGAESVDMLATRLFDALADRTQADDEALPSTGIPLERERQLSAAFIRTPDQVYGTRCSTLVITEKVNRHLVTHVLERTFSATGGVALLRRSMLKDWPPRYAIEGVAASEQEPVSESELPAAEVAVKRVRTLLKPDVTRKRKRAVA
jgi:uncharacterized protein with NRDE domain